MSSRTKLDAMAQSAGQDCQVYLVPGFFGFTSIGALNYFHRVDTVLAEMLAEHGINATIIDCQTQPTGSIRRRADRLLDDVLAGGGRDATAIHFVGHSTGGLDIRLLTTPGVRLRPDDSEDDIASRTKSVITVATPHFGTPMANFFTTLAGRQLLEVLTVLATTKGGRYALFGAARMVRTLSRLDDLFGRQRTFLDSLASSILRRISTNPNDPMWQFLREVASDQGAIIQLTPESMHLFNAAVTDRDDLHYGCIVTAAPPPPRYYSARETLSLAKATMAGAFTLLHAITSRAHRHYPYPHAGLEALTAFVNSVPFAIDERTNDGIVPTLSQIYGKVLSVVVGDHLDVVGQFPNASPDPHSDWLPSGSGYDEARFRATWKAVADEIAASMA